jgi:glycosyltransferase involved in cell wall biosynthesis
VKTILHMIETGGTGGAETVYLNLVRGLTRWRHVTVLPKREWMYDQLTDFGMQPILLADRRVFDVVYFARMTALIKRRGVDLIHAHLFGSAVRAALLARVCGIPAIATLHGGIDLGARERFRRLKVEIVNRGLKQIVFVSEPLRRSLLESVPLRPDLATVIPNGIDASRFSSSDGHSFRAEFGIAPDEFVVGTVGTPGRSAKGLDVLLDVAALLKTRSPGIRFVIVGDLDLGRGTELLSQRAARGLTDDVIITGFRSDVPRALAAFDVYALTSRSEGFSLALIEAMASGLPVVATRCGGPEQIVTDGVTGLLVENGSVEAIATAIERLRSSAAERQRLGAGGRDAVKQRFSLDKQLRSYERLYEQCLANGAGSSTPERDHAHNPGSP